MGDDDDSSRQRPQADWPAQPPPYTYSEDDYGARPPRRVPGRRAGTSLLVLLLLAAAFVIGDRVAKAYAQGRIAQQIQTQASLAARPAVSIEGFPFLTQVAARDLRKVDISASNVPAGRITISSVTATATGVHLNSGFNGATIDQIHGTALVTFASLVSAAGAKGVTVRSDPAAGPNDIAISAGPQLSATGQVTQTGPSQVTIKVTQLGGLAGLAPGAVGSLPGYVITIPTLPAGLKVDGVSVTGRGIEVQAAAQDTTLSH